ncbi:MAG: TetR/AcrR family transcriptional regulator [Beijerinckiaceae bacterium]
MTKVQIRREAQRIALIDAAEQRIARDGLAGVKARDLAQDIGVALGAIYNLVADLDELMLRVASRTLARLDRALEQAAMPAGMPTACDRLVAIALAYRSFATAHTHLWRSLFEYRMQADRPLPEWAVIDQMHLFRHILEPLAALMPDAPEAERQTMASTLFSAVHGVVSLGLEGKLVAVPERLLDQQIERLVRLLCASMGSQKSI